MLKRSRAPSPSPTRADPSSPPPLDDKPRLPLSKRRRTVGPIINSVERRDGVTEDDGEDDEDFDYDLDSTNMSTPDDKVYENVNHLLHCLHAEHQHRSRSAQSHTRSSFTHQNSHIAASSIIVTPNDSPPPCSSPFSSPAKYLRDSQSCPSPMATRHHESMMPRGDVENASECSDFGHGMTQAIPSKIEHGEDERLRVAQRYEDTNRLLGSLVLSRRRTLRSPSVDSE